MIWTHSMNDPFPKSSGFTWRRVELHTKEALAEWDEHNNLRFNAFSADNTAVVLTLHMRSTEETFLQDFLVILKHY